MSRSRLIALLLSCATLLVFLPVGRFSFVNFDDTEYVTENSFVKNGLTGVDIAWAFTAFHSGNWHPLTWLSHMLDCQLFGLIPRAHHFVNVLWHALNVALLFTWLLRLTHKLWPAAFIAALFAWHPLHVESVVWISERKDVLSTFFALLALLAYTKYAQENNRRSFWLALGFFAMGLLAKPMLVTLPCVLLLLDFWPFKRLTPFNKTVWLEKIPFFLLTVASCVVTFFAQKQGEAVASLTRVSLFYRLENAPVAIASYLGKFFLPIDLCVIYPIHSSLPGWEVGLSVAILIAISMLAWRWRKVRPYFLMGWLWFLGMLVPVIGLVQVGAQTMADRYTYLPSIGFFIMLVFLLAELAEKIHTPKSIVGGVAAVICLACILGTEYQLQFWRDSETLFRRAVAVTRDNSVALLNLGATLAAQGHFDEALGQLHAALQLAPGRYQTHNDIGNILEKTGRPAEAAKEYREAIRLNPRISYLHNSLGVALAKLGQSEPAQKEFVEAEKMDPQSGWPHVEMAKIFLEQSRDLEAVAELQAAVQLEPDNDEILAYAAQVFAACPDAAVRDGPTALKYALKANILGGDQVVILDALGMALAENGDYTNATTCAQNAFNIALASGLNNTNDIRARLELYQKNQPWRESFKPAPAPVRSPE